MALSNPEQLKKIFEESKHVLITLSDPNHGDALASALALKNFFTKKYKQADIVVNNFTIPKNLKFLPESDTIQPTLSNIQKFIIKVDISKAPIETISYDVKNNWLSIYLTPRFGAITRNELRTAQSTFKYDLIITLGTPDLESLGDIFFNNTDLFYKTPLVNIDHQSNNEQYGQINIVDLTATSIAELIYQEIKLMNSETIDASVATALLTGMIIATKSFKIPHLKPHTLTMASELVGLGAEREKIIQHIYRTRSIAALKLWGQALMHLEIYPKLKLIIATLTRDDFIRAGATVDDLQGITDELLGNSPEAHLILLLYEREEPKGASVEGIFSTTNNQNALQLMKSFHPSGAKRQACFIVPGGTLSEVKKTALELIETTQTALN